MSHRGCGGEIVADWSKIYKHENDFGIEEHPAYLCIKCGKEILGDVDIDLDPDDEEEMGGITLAQDVRQKSVDNRGHIKYEIVPGSQRTE